MKTAKEWAVRVQNSKEPWDTLVWEIQSDALQFAAAVCLTRANQMHTYGIRADELRQCVDVIESKRVAAMPNDKQRLT